jgi:hypothetical protein
MRLGALIAAALALPVHAEEWTGVWPAAMVLNFRAKVGVRPADRLRNAAGSGLQAA